VSESIIDWQPASSAELCLYLILTLPDEARRLAHIKDFCRIYEVKERTVHQPGSDLAKLGRIIGPQPAKSS
jgi:hypothetical protein